MRRPLLIALLAGTASMTSVSAADPRPAPTAALTLRLALFFSPAPTSDPLQVLATACGGLAVPIPVVEQDDATGPVPRVCASWMPLERCPPPDAGSWPYRAVGLEDAARKAVLTSGRALTLAFTIPPAGACAANLQVSRILAELAQKTAGLPYDAETRQIFSVAAWQAKRVDSWADGRPFLRDHIILDQYREDGLFRLVSMGMAKFALPDLCAGGVTSDNARTMGLLLNATGQALVEGAAPAAKAGGPELTLHLDFAIIKHAAARAWLQKDLGPRATGSAAVLLRARKPEAGDADNELLGLDFAVSGATATERQEAACAEAFGSSDAFVSVDKGDPALLAARDHARAGMPDVRRRFAAGLQPKETLHVKAGFASADGRIEYMWVEVTGWTAAGVEGILANDPQIVETLKSGQPVKAPDAQLYDWMWTHLDGSQEGNETGTVLERLEKERKGAAPPRK